MITKKNIVDQVLASGRLTLDEAVKRAMAVKEIKNKDAIRAWKNMFAQNGVITRDETGTYVSPKMIEVTAAPIVITNAVIAKVETITPTEILNKE